ncbi:MAG TPA: Fic family protein [Lacibacter sp.]|nr:Fic family protein [Lacibacter sp.]HMO90006.1 Fic family protein [Lacibacter sp.]
MKPPYTLTSGILHQVAAVSEKLGQLQGSRLQLPRAELRKSNRIKTIQSSLAIEGNTLNLDQVTALLENKRVRAPQKDIAEVKNAIAVYGQLEQWQPYSLRSFLRAHALFMKDLLSSAGKFRSSAVGVAKGNQLTHIAPPAHRVRSLMQDLFSYARYDKDPLLIKSCVFHYELEFIHPFTDGNGRMGRLWQTVLLMQYNPLFAYLPVESIIKDRQSDYYQALQASDKSGQATPFIEFMLAAVSEALTLQLKEQAGPLRAADRIELFRRVAGTATFSRKMYLDYHRSISPATASRDLHDAVVNNILSMSGDKRNATYMFR